MTQLPDRSFETRLRYDEPMSAHTSWHAGGPAEIYFSPHDVQDVVSFLKSLPMDVPVTWVGLGTNLLVREGGIRGVVVATPGAFTRIERRGRAQVYCEASVPCARIARLGATWGMRSAEFFGGIPGTCGGALAMNAGAFGEETWPHVVSVETIDRCGELRTRPAEDFDYSYRRAALKSPGAYPEWYLAAMLQFDAEEPGSAAGSTGQAEVQSLLQRRRETQPLGSWSCGSVFKNPPGDHAARLIESAGLKGYQIGDAVVSPKHANFIINQGAARPSDLERLIEHVQSTVERVHGIRLQPEVRIIGEPAPAAQRGGA